MTLDAMLDAIRAECAVPVPQSPAMPDGNPLGWSDRLQRVTLEPVSGQPNQWREPVASAALCIWCPEPLDEGDRLGCEQHRMPALVTAAAAPEVAAIERDDLLALAEQRGWGALPLGPGVKAGGTEAMWRTFVDNASPAQFQRAVVASSA